MFKKLFKILAVVVVVLLIVIAMQPEDFRVSRSEVMAAQPGAVFPLVNDLRRWEEWSPWAKIDPNAKETFEGADSGEGAILRWAGNSEVGEGSMTVVESRPNELVRIRLDFLRPFEATNNAVFTFVPDAAGTRVTWTMDGKNNFVGKAISLVMDCEKMVGGYFEQGLGKMKSIAESASK